MQPIKVLIVDDSAFMRQLLKDTLSASDLVELLEPAGDGLSAITKIKKYRPDVVIMDIEMPVMDGLSALKIIKEECPTPTIVFSGLSDEWADMTLKAFDLGAFDCIMKDKLKKLDVGTMKDELLKKIISAYQSQHPLGPAEKTQIKEKSVLSLIDTKAEIVIIGTSTGGPKALLEIVPKLPADIPIPIIVIQHMPLYFTSQLAKRLAEKSQIQVKEAETGDKLEGGKLFIAKGDYHLGISYMKKIKLNQEPPYCGVRPSMTKTLLSAAKIYGGKILGVVMTGMGHDGCEGIRAIKQLGGKCIVEDESTCEVFGMPKAIIDDGNADRIVPLQKIPYEIVKALAYW